MVWDRAVEAAAGRRRDGGGTEAGRDTESKTRTPHKDAGKKQKRTLYDYWDHESPRKNIINGLTEKSTGKYGGKHPR